MYNDIKEYIGYIKKKRNIITEPIHESSIVDFNVLNQNLNFDKISADFYEDGYAIVDDLLNPEIASRLRYFVYNTNIRHDYYHDYATINFALFRRPNGSIWFPLLSAINEEVMRKIRLFDNYKNSARGWAVIHDNIQTEAPKPHVDSADLTLNLWVTPDKCVDKKSDQYNGIVLSQSNDLSKFQHSVLTTIPYKFNRAMIFGGNNVHYSLLSRFKKGYENRKVNYTFLYERKK